MSDKNTFDKVELTLLRSCVKSALQRQDKKVVLYEKRGKDLDAHYATMMRADLADIIAKLDTQLKAAK